MDLRVWSFAAVSALLLAPGSSRADGAIAHGRDGSNGLSYNYRGPRSADNAALEYCGEDCRIVERYRNACAAIARAPRGGYGYAVRDSVGAARRAAMANCENQNDRCEMFLSGCDD